MASPDPKRQQQYQQGQQPPPEYEPFSQEAKKERKGIDWTNAKSIENWLNGFKSGFENYLREKHQEAISSNLAFTHHLFSYLTMYQGEIVGEYLSEGTMEMLFSALGPIGNLWRSAYGKNISWKMAWMKNPLNPNAIYYYFNALPSQKAFEIAMLPIKGAMAIMAKGGGPFTETTYTDYNGVVRKEYLFTPIVQATKVAHSLADGLDKLSGFSTNTFDHTRPEEKKVWNEDNSKWKQDINQVNQGLTTALENLSTAKKSGNKQGVGDAYKEMDKFLNKYNGSIFRKFLGNTARRLRSTERDPISYLLSLLGGAVWDFISFFTLNLAKTIVGKAINLIPGVKVLNAQITKFITSDKFLTNAAVGGSSLRSIIQGTLSPATASFGYVGYRGFSSLFPNASVNQLMNPFTGEIFAFTVNPAGLIGGAATLSAGIFYNVALKMAATTNYYWTSQYQLYRSATMKGWALDKGATWGDQMIKENYFKGFKPGPISNFAKFLAEHPFARIPINGLAIGDLVSPLMQQYYGWNPWVTRGVFAGVDYLMQTRQAWGRLLTQDTWKIFGKSFYTPYYYSFSLNNPSSFGSWLRGKYLKIFYEPSLGTWDSAVVERPWFNTFKKFYSPVRPFFQNFFNPGFFMGFGLVPLLSPAMGIWAYVVGPITGSIGWNIGAKILESTFGRSLGVTMSKINAWGWARYLIGSVLQLIFPSLPFWFNMLTAGLGVATGMIFSTSWASSFLISAGSRLIAAIPALAGATGIYATAIAVMSTVMAIGSVTLLTVFFAYSIYASFWVPMVEEAKAGQQSSNFYINNSCQKTGTNQYYCCSNFAVTENILNGFNRLDHKTDFSNTDLSIDLSTKDNVEKNTDAWLNNKSLTYDPAGDAAMFLKVPYYAVNTAVPVVNGQGAGQAAVLTYLPTPSDEALNLFQLMSQYPSVVSSLKPFWDILVRIAQDKASTDRLLAEYQAQQDLLEAQKELVDKLINKIEAGDLDGALTAAQDYLDPKKHPLGTEDPCPPGSVCPEEKQSLNNLYDSWQQIVNSYISQIEVYLRQADPDLARFLEQLKAESESLAQQIEAIKQIKAMIEDINMSEVDAAIILDWEEHNMFLNFPNLDLDLRESIWKLLSTYFPDVFNENDLFYFIPRGTDYKVCLNLTYSGPIPGNPQTVCSTISYTPPTWTPTGFAKACSTFTPQ